MSDPVARQHISRPISRPHTTMTGKMTTHIGPATVAKPVRGMKTKTDKAPMSTPDYSKHQRSYSSHLNGAGNRH